jgi:hypothetical protein
VGHAAAGAAAGVDRATPLARRYPAGGVVNETLLLVFALAPILVAPLAIVSNCGGAPFDPELTLGDAEILTAYSDFVDYVRRQIAEVFFIPRQAIEPEVKEVQHMRQLEHFSIVMKFDMDDGE